MSERSLEASAPLLVCGNANVETVLRAPRDWRADEDSFLDGALGLGVSGVGANLALALRALGSDVRLLTFGAPDAAGALVRAALSGVDVTFAPAARTPQSLAVVREDGERVFHRDLGGTREAPAPARAFERLAWGARAALITNVPWTRDLLPLARRRGLPILTDVHDVRDLDNPYDAPYLAAADVVFLSAERLVEPGATLHELLARFPARLVVAGWGGRGALLLERGGALHHQAAFEVAVTSTGGAGDALAASFAHFHFTRGLAPREALRFACAAAALKLHAAGSGEGHATEDAARRLARR